MPEWREVSDDDDEHHVSSKIRRRFKSCSGSLRIRILTDLIHMCTSQQLSFIHQLVSPMLKMDPFTMLPDELCLRVGLASLSSCGYAAMSRRGDHR